MSPPIIDWSIPACTGEPGVRDFVARPGGSLGFADLLSAPGEQVEPAGGSYKAKDFLIWFEIVPFFSERGVKNQVSVCFFDRCVNWSSNDYRWSAW